MTLWRAKRRAGLHLISFPTFLILPEMLRETVSDMRSIDKKRAKMRRLRCEGARGAAPAAAFFRLHFNVVPAETRYLKQKAVLKLGVGAALQAWHATRVYVDLVACVRECVRACARVRQR